MKLDIRERQAIQLKKKRRALGLALREKYGHLGQLANERSHAKSHASTIKREVDSWYKSLPPEEPFPIFAMELADTVLRKIRNYAN